MSYLLAFWARSGVPEHVNRDMARGVHDVVLDDAGLVRRKRTDGSLGSDQPPSEVSKGTLENKGAS
eukprot:694704-Rhodomonas_salina.5